MAQTVTAPQTPCSLGIYEKAMPDEVPMEKRLEAAAAAGYDFWEISVDESDARLARMAMPLPDRLALAGMARSAGVPIGSVCLSGNRRFPIGSADDAKRDAGIRLIMDCIGFASDIGARIIQVAGYDATYGEPSTPATRERFLMALAGCTAAAAREGVTLALETMEDDFMNTTEKAMGYVRAINSPWLLVYPDIGNIYNGAADPFADVETARGHVAAVHLKETLPGVFRNLMFGEGQVDFAGVVRRLRAMGVCRFNAEFWYDKDKGSWEQRIRAAHDTLRPLLQ